MTKQDKKIKWYDKTWVSICGIIILAYMAYGIVNIAINESNTPRQCTQSEEHKQVIDKIDFIYNLIEGN